MGVAVIQVASAFNFFVNGLIGDASYAFRKSKRRLYDFIQMRRKRRVTF